MATHTHRDGDAAAADPVLPLESERVSETTRRHMRLPSWHGLLRRRLGGAWLALGLALGVGFLTRCALLAKSAGDVAWDASLVRAFGWGMVFDLGAALWWTAGIAVILAILPARTFSYRWAKAAAYLGVFGVLCALCFGAVAEWVFWDEFGARFNFIAVDYLVYTTEVVGNIRESYPMPTILTGIGVVAAVGVFALHRVGLMGAWLGHAPQHMFTRWRGAAIWVVASITLGVALRQDRIENFTNAYNGELAKDGLWSFFAAFRGNVLDFDAFYPTIPADSAFRRVDGMIAAADSMVSPRAPAGHDLLRPIVHAGPEQRLNVIQITVESLSADFFARFGNKQGITPNLDALASRSLVFDDFYATGNRTDRGMEALTLSVPPTPGRSLVKRPENAGLFTLGSVFRSKGYSTAFIYGGYGYFDNMNAFFGGNGYKVIDRTKVASGDITFANVWGACDEDVYRWTLREADEQYARGKPFYHFVMTTSNHRPFTFPEGRIDLPSKTSGRQGGVKYTDFAIGEFIKAAATHPWFNNTVFVIVADHCASSAGKTELPVQNYHIPLIIYAPGGQIAPGAVAKTSSQIDYAPTLLGLLGWSYESRFFGRDLLAMPQDVPGRALIGNYQKLGLYQNGKLAVLQPVRRSGTYRYDPATRSLTVEKEDAELTSEAISYYETASWLFKHRAQVEFSAK
jgi:phosphoglycerol transferase MdoB-like AlkP superfamily enzyme